MTETPLEILSQQASPDAAQGFIDWRKLIKKPLTARAAKMILKTLQEISVDNGDADEALDLAQEHGWQTIKPSWYWRIKNELTSYRRGIPDRRDNRTDPALEQIFRLSGFS